MLDFGISKLIDEDDSTLSLTKSRSIIGSPLYMSPEQLRSARSVDTRSDIWSLGVLLFELIHGQPPFVTDSVAVLGAMVLAGPIPRLADVRPGTPPALDAAIRRCMERDPNQRFPSVVELVEALLPFAETKRELAERILRRPRERGSAPSLDPFVGIDRPSERALAAADDIASAATVPMTPRAASAVAVTEGRSRTRTIAIAAFVLVSLGACGLALSAFALGRRSAPKDAASAEVASSSPTASATLVSPANDVLPEPLRTVVASAPPPPPTAPLPHPAARPRPSPATLRLTNAPVTADDMGRPS